MRDSSATLRSLPTLLALAGLLALASPAVAQTDRRPLDHDDYDRWMRITQRDLSPDGAWLAWVTRPGDGDPALFVRNVETTAQLTIPRADDFRFTGDSRWVVASLHPAQVVVDSLRRAGERGDDLPGDSLVVVDLATVFGSGGEIDPAGLWRAGPVESFRVPEDGAVLAYVLEAADEDEAEEEAEQPGREERGREEAEEAPRTDPGSTLVLRTLAEGAETRFSWVTDYRFTDDGTLLYYAASSEEGDADGVFRVVTASGSAEALATGEGRYLGLRVQEDGHRAAFMTDRDDRDPEQPSFAVWVADASGEARPVAGPQGNGIPAGWWVSEHGDLSISGSGERVFFGTAPRPEPDSDGEDDETLPDEEVRLDVWNWRDPHLQPMQLLEAEEERERAFDAWVPFEGGAAVQLATPDLPTVRMGQDGDAEVALGLTDLPYRQLISWDGRYVDAWIVDAATGERRLAQETIRGSASLSPEGRWLYWWDGLARAWFARPSHGGDAVNLTADLPHAVHDELDDHPQPPPPYGMAGWTGGDASMLVYDRHDIWAVDPTGARQPRNVTEGVGRREGLRFRYLSLEPDRESVPTDEPVLLSAFELETKRDGFYRDRFDGAAPPTRLLMDDAAFSRPDRADDADRLLYTRETFQDFPDLWVSGPDFAEGERHTSLNDELRREVLWGTAELVEWISNDGIPLQGILYKPEGFDPSEQYPMMVYFYERMSDGLHRHRIPAAGSSSINFTFYVSRGYLVFVPDIPYEIGHPGESALDAVVPGVLALVDEGFVDPDDIGVQGHSWGGYQIAWMITRTNVFAAAEAGAPVANMTSAYGGIRWGSGMSRMFQYERTQSRIGGSLWDAPLLYIENSPLFTADKIETPLLMMHNDEDTAVPWYQGIEMFVALRRLQKPVWLLNYNGEPHGLRREANQKDWAIRMQQFFDHYLKDAPPPVWLAEGVPAVLKGETLGLDLLTEEATTEESGGGN